MENITRTARTLDRVMRVLFGLFLAAAIACALAFAAMLFLPEEWLLGFGTQSIDLGVVSLTASQDAQDLIRAGALRPLFLMLLACAAVFSALMAWAMRLTRGILSPMAEGRPFDDRVSGRLKTLGFISLACVVALAVTRCAVTALMTRAIDFPALLSGGFIAGYTVHYRFEAGYLLIPAVLFLLSHVFCYGEALQRQADETL